MQILFKKTTIQRKSYMLQFRSREIIHKSQYLTDKKQFMGIKPSGLICLSRRFKKLIITFLIKQFLCFHKWATKLFDLVYQDKMPQRESESIMKK